MLVNIVTKNLQLCMISNYLTIILWEKTKHTRAENRLKYLDFKYVDLKMRKFIQMLLFCGS